MDTNVNDRRAWLGLAVLALPTLLTTLDLSVLFLALPHLAADLAASAVQQLWISDIYGFLIAGFLVTMGTLGDRIGRRRLLLYGAAAFAVLSAAAAYAPTAGWLIACRALLGIAGATIMPSCLALIRNMFPNPKQMGAAIAVWASALTLGVALGPIVGGVLLNWFWWGSVLLIAVPVMAAVLVAGPRLLPDPKDPNPGRLDPISVVLSLAAILPFVYGLKEVARAGWHAVPVAALLVGGAVGVTFVARQRRLASPLLDVRLFANRTIRGALLVGLFVAAVQGGSGFFIAQYLQMVKGMTPLAAGLWTLVPTVALVFGIFVSQGMAQRIRPAYVVAAGAGIAAIGMLTLTQIDSSSSVLALIGAVTVVFVGVSPVGPLVSQLVVPSVPPERAGAAASLNATSGELGIALGIAVLGSVGTAVYRGRITLPAEVAGAPATRLAGETIGSAMSVAQSLPNTVANALMDSARAAFTSGLNVTAAVCMVVLAGLAVLVVSTLRHVEPLQAAQATGKTSTNVTPADGGQVAEQATQRVPAGVS